jgi:hypothetical protein
LFANKGLENPVQLGCPGGQVTVKPVSDVVINVEFCMLVTPADCGHDVVPLAFTQLPGGALATGVPMPCVSTPEEARLSLLEIVLLRIATFNESCSDIPAPSQPARLFTIMLLVMETPIQIVAAA